MITVNNNNVMSDSWNNGYVDGLMGLGQDKDYVEKMGYIKDVEDYEDGYGIGLDASYVMSIN
jgi:hypothetical protein